MNEDFYVRFTGLVGATQRKILAVLSDGCPRTQKEIVHKTGLSDKVVEGALYRLWKKGFILRTEKPSMELDRVFKGRAGTSSHLRLYHLYVLKPGEADSIWIKGLKFVKAKEGKGLQESRAKLILKFLEGNCDKAFYSKEVVEALKSKGVKPRDIMTHVRRFERRGLVYVRGYRTHGRQTPFKDGYLITWIDPSKPREQTIEEAVERTNKALAERSSISSIVERIHLIRDQIIEATKLKDIVSFEFIQNKLGCSEGEAEGAIKRAFQLYPDLKEIKLFNVYRYFYHASMAEEDLKATIALKENYIRAIKGRDNRIGHNWEAVVEWFVDKYTTGAVFQTQAHRTQGIDPRRITLHLIMSVGGRRQSAEVDRVWSVTPSIFAQPITYVLECKWGLVQKKNVDDFFEVLRWSKEFGVDTPDGRQVKQGIVGVFAGSAFNPKESVRLKDETEISLATYAARMNIQLLKASDFNDKLRERGVPKEFTTQKICRIARDEKEVREVLETIWENPGKSEEILAKVAEKNKDVYEFEKMLEEGRRD